MARTAYEGKSSKYLQEDFNTLFIWGTRSKCKQDAIANNRGQRSPSTEEDFTSPRI